MKTRILCAILAVLMVCSTGCTPKSNSEPSGPSIEPSTLPSLSQPNATTPSAPEPSTTEPSVTQPGISEPEVTDPSVTEPSVSIPTITEPSLSEPSTSEPSITEPSVTNPSETEPSVLTGWQEIDGKRYYYDADGTPHVGWLELSGDRYYFRADGTMATGRVVISDSETRYFTSTGKEVILVNPWNYVPDDYEVNLTTYDGYKMAQEVKEPLKQMLADCKAAGFEVIVVSAYRTHSYQTGLFERRIQRFIDQGYNRVEATIEAAKRVAVPGTSEHELGLALDITDKNYQNLNKEQENKPAQQWVMKNCWKYGFILRYPNEKSEITGIIYEPWHYRYVGIELATELHELGICLEEYLEMLTDPNEPAHQPPTPEYPELIPTEPTEKPSEPEPHVHDLRAAASVEPTCEVSGYVIYQCSGCDYSETQLLPAPGHNFSAATCTTPSSCNQCGSTVGQPLPHSYGPDGMCAECGGQDSDYVRTMDLTITIKTDKNIYVQGITVHIFVSSELVASGRTDENGVARFTISACDGYLVTLADVPEHLEGKESYAYSSAYGNIVLKTRSVGSGEDHSQANYQVGDTVTDFVLTDTNGNQHRLYDLLEEKNAVVLNFWFVDCEPCKQEFPYLNTAYAQYQDQVALLAISPMDTDPRISALKEQMQLSFPMMHDDIQLSTGFNVEAFPTTVIIGKNHRVLYIHTGVFETEEEVLALFAPFAQ